jgi:hypothetical protein
LERTTFLAVIICGILALAFPSWLRVLHPIRCADSIDLPLVSVSAVEE